MRGCVVQGDTLWWQVRYSGHAPPRSMEFAPPPLLAFAGRVDGVEHLTNQARCEATGGHSPHPPPAPVGEKRSSPPPLVDAPPLGLDLGLPVLLGLLLLPLPC